MLLGNEGPSHQIRLVRTKTYVGRSSENLRDFYVMKWIDSPSDH